MHQPIEEEGIFKPGDIVRLNNGMPDFESFVGFGVVIQVRADSVDVHWHSDVWIEGRTQKMSACEIRHANLL
jgi:hypothetical protein